MYDASSTHTAKGLKVILDSLRVPVDVFKYRPDKTISLTEIKVLSKLFFIMHFLAMGLLFNPV